MPEDTRTASITARATLYRNLINFGLRPAEINEIPKHIYAEMALKHEPEPQAVDENVQVPAYKHPFLLDSAFVDQKLIKAIKRSIENEAKKQADKLRASVVPAPSVESYPNARADSASAKVRYGNVTYIVDFDQIHVCDFKVEIDERATGDAHGWKTHEAGPKFVDLHVVGCARTGREKSRGGVVGEDGPE